MKGRKSEIHPADRNDPRRCKGQETWNSIARSNSLSAEEASSVAPQDGRHELRRQSHSAQGRVQSGHGAGPCPQEGRRGANKHPKPLRKSNRRAVAIARRPSRFRIGQRREYTSKKWYVIAFFARSARSPNLAELLEERGIKVLSFVLTDISGIAAEYAARMEMRST